MLVFVELVAGFSARCALPVIACTFLLTHPHHLTIRELTLANASHSKDERGSLTSPAPLDLVMRLRHKLVDVVVEAVLYAVDVA
jgi:hypothetical protein